MKLLKHRLLPLILLGLMIPTDSHGNDKGPLLSQFSNYASSYFQNPLWQNSYKTLSNLCAIGSMCGSGLAWFGKTALAGTAYTTELIRNNSKIAGTIALYTAWYIGQKRWAEDTINKAEKLLKSINSEDDLKPTFKTWQTVKYRTIAPIMNNKEAVAEDLINSYNLFDPKTFCTCLKVEKSADQNKKALAIKLALKIEYIATKKMLDLFTENRTISLTNVPYWIKKWIEANYKDNIQGTINPFDPYNIRSGYNTSISELEGLVLAAKTALASFPKDLVKNEEKGKEKEEETLSSEPENQNFYGDKERKPQYQKSLSEAQEGLNKLRTKYEGELTQFIEQKIALTGLPVRDFASELPTAYWKWGTAPLPTPEANLNSGYAFIDWTRGTSALFASGLKRAAHISSGLIWPYEQKASQLYWELFQYLQRIAALDSAISEYIKEHNLPDVSSSYNLNNPLQLLNAIKEFSESSEACNAQYCIEKLKALQAKK